VKFKGTNFYLLFVEISFLVKNMSNKIPYVNILQSAICIPVSDQVPIALDIKILPDKNIPAESFFGVWLLDVSGSMGGERLDKAKDSLIEQIGILPEGTIYNLITFESKVNEIIKDVKISDKSRKDIIKKIQGITERGTTSLYTALEKALEILRKYARKSF